MKISVIYLSLFLIGLAFSSCENDEANKSFQRKSFKGIVISKYLDHSQHSMPVIDILDQEKKDTITIDFFLDKSGSYNKINISDYIIKESGSMGIYIKRDEKIILLTRVNFRTD